MNLYKSSTRRATKRNFLGKQTQITDLRIESGGEEEIKYLLLCDEENPNQTHTRRGLDDLYNGEDKTMN